MSGNSNQVDSRKVRMGAPPGMVEPDEEVPLGNVTYDFIKGEVHEYISNPSNYMSRSLIDLKTKEYIGNLEAYMLKHSSESNKPVIVSNSQISPYIPANSIKVYIQDIEYGTPVGQKSYLAYPYFPPHFVLPLKPGEQVWLLRETKGDTVFYYWQCRVHAGRQVDDLNFTNHDRSSDVALLYRKYLISGNVTDKNYLVPASANTNNPSGLSPATLNATHAGSIAFMEEHIAEPVPRTFGKCSDTIIQGSNNSTIHLTTEKFRNTENISSELFLNPDSPENSDYTHTPLAGAIDLFVGKEKSRLSELVKDARPENLSAPGKFNVRLSSRESGGQTIETYETDKLDQFVFGKENQNEGNDSPRNVFSRLYLGMNASPDKSFEITNNDFKDDSSAGPSAVLYSDHIRCFAEDSIRLHVYPTDDKEKDEGVEDNVGGGIIEIKNDGTISLQSNHGDGAAAIVLKPNGDILINPKQTSDKRIYLGNQEATEDAVLGNVLVSKLTQLCTAIETMTVATAVGPSSIPSTQPSVQNVRETLSDILSDTTKLK